MCDFFLTYWHKKNWGLSYVPAAGLPLKILQWDSIMECLARLVLPWYSVGTPLSTFQLPTVYVEMIPPDS